MPGWDRWLVLSYDYLAQLLAALSLCEAELTITTIFISYIVIFYSALIPLTLLQITQRARPLMMMGSLIPDTPGAVDSETDTNCACVAIIDPRENEPCNSQVIHLTRIIGKYILAQDYHTTPHGSFS